ncbi:MAG: hypothetical protein Athens071426_317 [Parcubacteria group bacterium Athens0714_26]|nr:MAG: hypothetical protein Athens071426_317 [Parcubacteria group bacterium Athens0714_26]
MKLKKDIKIIVTLGPATKQKQDLQRIKEKGVDFVRVNMSHSPLEEFQYFMGLAKEVGVPFIVDTEGSQIRMGFVENGKIKLEENQIIRLCGDEIVGNKNEITLKPKIALSYFTEGDLIYVDFDTVVLQVVEVSTISKGYIVVRVVVGGLLGSNKGAVVDSLNSKKFNLPVLTDKDYKAITLGLKAGVKHIAVSFVRSAADVKKVREVTKNKMKIISKVECLDALHNLDEIIKASDFILIDRGDLSKEISLEKIPFAQKFILKKAKQYKREVFIATNLLETMVNSAKPTRAEANDVINSIVDGAAGLTLAAETAIGKYPMECIDVLNSLIKHSQMVISPINEKKSRDYLLDPLVFSSLVEPHGGKLVNRVLNDIPSKTYLNSLKKIKINDEQYMDVEQIALGVFGPLEGFMIQRDFLSVLKNMRLAANGVVWPLPIVLDVDSDEAKKIKIGEDIALIDSKNNIVAVMRVEDKYTFDKEMVMKKVYGTLDNAHPGVRHIKAMKPVLIGGKIDLIKRRDSLIKRYELTPLQTRKLFEEKHWINVVGFHTRNVIHMGHEFVQISVLKKEHCDGLFVHPAVGSKKAGDFASQYIMKSYEIMLERFYPAGRVALGAFASYSRYGGPREAVFTAKFWV